MINNITAATPWGYYYNPLNMTATVPQSYYVNPWALPWWASSPPSYPFYTQITAPTSEETERVEEVEDSTDLSETIREIVREEIAAFKKELASEVIKEIVAQTRRNAGRRA
jgi:hypothetical protein